LGKSSEEATLEDVAANLLYLSRERGYRNRLLMLPTAASVY